MDWSAVTTLEQTDSTIIQLASMLEQVKAARETMRGRNALHVRFVTINKFTELTGYTKPAVNGKMRDGVWLEGLIWVHGPDGRRLINLDAYDRWASGELSRAVNQ